MVHDDVELEAARPNERLRAALLEALDLADRAGVALTMLSGSTYGGGAPSLNLHASTSRVAGMSHTDALRILLRVEKLDAVETGPVTESTGGRLSVCHTTRTRSGCELNVYALPSPALLERYAAVRS